MIKIVFDSGCDINSVLAYSGFDYEQVPLTINIGDKTFIDKDINIEEYLQTMEDYGDPAKSAAPSPEAYLEAFEGYGEIYCVTISSAFSGSHGSAMVARDMYLEKYPNAKVYIIDSKLATAGETAVACKMVGKLQDGLRGEELIEALSVDIEQTICYFILESFQNLTKNGRMNPMIAKIASVMNIKPICKGYDHEISLVLKPRGTEKAYQKLTELISSDNRLTEKSTLYITHIQSIEAATLIRKMILDKIKVKEIIINECTGLCATYAERHGLVIAY